QLVVGLDAHELAVRRQQVEADQRGGRAADAEQQRDRDHVEDADALVVEREQPRAPVPAAAQVAVGRCDVLMGTDDHAVHGTTSRVALPFDLTYSMISSNSSSPICPRNDGMEGS